MNVRAATPELLSIPVGLIDEPELPSRSTMDESKLEELAASMRTVGFISTIVAARHGDRFRVVAGHRRTLAARLAGVATVPALVYPSSADALEAVQHAENRHREDLNPAEEAIWFHQLLEKYPDGGTDGVAARVGDSRAYVEGRLALFLGDGRIFEALSRGKITIGVAQQLNRIDSELYRRSMLDQAISNGATVAIVNGWVQEYQRSLAPMFKSVESAAADAPPSSPINNDYFTCRLCGLKKNTGNMRPVNVHDYCIEATLLPALDLFTHRGDYLRAPRTVDEAAQLLNELCDRFPALLDPTPRSA